MVVRWVHPAYSAKKRWHARTSSGRALSRLDGGKTGVEVDGPAQFAGRTTGSRILKHSLVANLDGFPVVSVPYRKWDKLGRPGRNKEKKRQYLRSLLGVKMTWVCAALTVNSQ